MNNQGPAEMYGPFIFLADTSDMFYYLTRCFISGVESING